MKYFLLLSLIAVTLSTYGQKLLHFNVEIDGKPLPDVNVLNKYRHIGSATDYSGNTTVNAYMKDSIIISSIGFKTISFMVDSLIYYSDTLYVNMLKDTILLDEVLINKKLMIEYMFMHPPEKTKAEIYAQRNLERIMDEIQDELQYLQYAGAANNGGGIPIMTISLDKVYRQIQLFRQKRK